MEGILVLLKFYGIAMAVWYTYMVVVIMSLEETNKWLIRRCLHLPFTWPYFATRRFVRNLRKIFQDEDDDDYPHRSSFE